MKAVKNILKTIAAGMVAIGILSIIFAFYYLQPAHTDNPRGNTDYVWISNSRWLKMTEGISWGRFDADGYNNPEVVENPDILVLGSSHTEATNVIQGKEFSSLLRNKLRGEYTIYNMGISGHNFLKVCQYLQNNLELYDTAPKAVIIETDNLTFTKAEIETMLSSGIAKSPSYNTGLIAASQKSPFFSALYHQVQGGLIDLLMPDKAKISNLLDGVHIAPPAAALSPATPFVSEDEALSRAYADMFAYLGKLQQQYDTQIIIFFHPMCSTQPDGSIKIHDQDIKAEFVYNCEQQNIHFVDMTESFTAMCNIRYKLPHGFVTGRIGYGHLNADGHAAIAEELYNAVTLLNKEGRI